MNHESRLYGRTSAQLREMCMRWFFRPIARKVFERHPEVERLYFAVAQFWSDDAYDEVNVKLIASASDAPWPQCLDAQHNRLIGPEDGGYIWHDDYTNDPAFEVFGQDDFLRDYYGQIVAFAPYCKEGCTQDDITVDAYLPYAVARRRPVTEADRKTSKFEGWDDRDPLPFRVEIEIVGQPLRPHLEDRWDAWLGRDELQERDRLIQALSHEQVNKNETYTQLSQATRLRDRALLAHEQLARAAATLTTAARAYLAQPSNDTRAALERALQDAQQAALARP